MSTKVRDIGNNLARSLADSEKLLEGLLDISRLEAGAMPTWLRSLDAHSVLRAVAAQFGPQAEANGLALEIELPASAPAVHDSATAMRAFTDHARSIVRCASSVVVSSVRVCWCSAMSVIHS